MSRLARHDIQTKRRKIIKIYIEIQYLFRFAQYCTYGNEFVFL